MKSDIDCLIKTETKKRIDIIESAEYTYPPTHESADIYIIIFLIAICMVLIALCMIGVI